MGVAARDFIPQEEGMTALEVARSQRGKMIRTGANHQDFIPDPSEPTVPVRSALSQREKADRAMEYAYQRTLVAERTDWLTAIERLKNWSAAQAVETISQMPFRLMEMYVTVEAAYGHRDEILRVFGSPDPSYAEKLAEIQASMVSDAVGEISVVEFGCAYCEYTAKNKAGLLAHARAKHGDKVAVSTEPQAGE